MNPMNLMQMFQNPQQFMQNIMGNNQIMSNPMVRNIMNMAQRGEGTLQKKRELILIKHLLNLKTNSP